MQRGLTLAVALLFAVPVLAATRTWSGAASNLWSNPASWGGTLPAAGDDLVFPTAANMHNTNDLPFGTVFRSISFTGGPYVISGNAIGLSNGISATAIGFENQLGLGVALTASQTWSTAVLSQQYVSSIGVNGQTLTLANAGSLTIGGLSNTGGAIVQAGSGDTILISEAHYLGSIIVNSGQLVFLVGRAGSLTVTGGTLVIESVSVLGPVNVTGGTLTLAGVTSSGGLTLGPGATLEGRLWSMPFPSHVVNGDVTLNNALLHLAGPSPNGITSFVLILNQSPDPVSGTFLGLPEGSLVAADSQQDRQQFFRISYVGGNGNDVTLTAVTPVSLFGRGALALLAFAIAAMALFVLRR